MRKPGAQLKSGPVCHKERKTLCPAGPAQPKTNFVFKKETNQWLLRLGTADPGVASVRVCFWGREPCFHPCVILIPGSPIPAVLRLHTLLQVPGVGAQPV